MIALTPEAKGQIDAFERYHVERQRPQALRNLGHALAEASLVILNAPKRGLASPRPYPELASLDLLWLKRGRYWIAYDPIGPIIAGVFFDTDDIPNRVDKRQCSRPFSLPQLPQTDVFHGGISTNAEPFIARPSGPDHHRRSTSRQHGINIQEPAGTRAAGW